MRSEFSRDAVSKHFPDEDFRPPRNLALWLQPLATPSSFDSGTPSGFFGPYDAFWIACSKSLSPCDLHRTTTNASPGLPHPALSSPRHYFRSPSTQLTSRPFSGRIVPGSHPSEVSPHLCRPSLSERAVLLVVHLLAKTRLRGCQHRVDAFTRTRGISRRRRGRSSLGRFPPSRFGLSALRSCFQESRCSSHLALRLLAQPSLPGLLSWALIAISS